MQACQIAEFIIKNTKSMMKSEDLYRALKISLEKLSSDQTDFQFNAVKLVYLHENGYLPDNLGKNSGEEQKKLIRNMVDYALGGKKPKLSSQYWKKFSEWIDVVCRYHELI
jgi:recombinational DNA repair protein (RecF pathway)